MLRNGPRFGNARKFSRHNGTLSKEDNESIVKPTEDKHMVCVSNHKATTFEMGTLLCEKNEEGDGNEEVELNLVDCKTSGNEEVELNLADCKTSHVNTPVKSKSPDTTESSSSFGDTISGSEIGDDESDNEVLSEFHGNCASALEFDDLLRVRKKRLTEHWRTYIQPLMWRSRWAELQMRRFQSQALKYEKILADIQKRKQLKVDSFAPDLGAKSLPYANDTQKGKIMKRKKRKRMEDLIDTALSNHTLFSYFGSKKSDDNATSNGTEWAQLDVKPEVDEEVGTPTNELSLCDFKDNSNSWEHLLKKIVMAQLKVGELKGRLHKVTSENGLKISPSTDKLSLLGPHNNNALTGSIPNPASPPNNGDKRGVCCIASQLIHAYNYDNDNNNNNMDDLVMPESAASSHGEVTHFPNIIESMDQPRAGGSWRSTEDGFLIHNTGANDELNDFGEAKTHPIDKKLKAPKKEQGTSSPHTDDQPTPKMGSISKISALKNKKKRGKRKARTGKWSRRSSG